jgi:hypothetical protein
MPRTASVRRSAVAPACDDAFEKLVIDELE